MFCERCGNPMSDDAAFCSKCGWGKNESAKGVNKQTKSPYVNKPTNDNVRSVKNTQGIRNQEYVHSEELPTNIKGVVGFACGILTVITFWWLWSMVIGIVGFIVSIIANKGKENFKPSKLPKFGIILSIAGIILGSIFTAVIGPMM